MEMLSDSKCKTLFELIKNSPGLDLRDNRGKTHCLSLVLLGVIIALFRSRDGNLSSIHRSIINNQASLCHILNIDFTQAVSRAQLPIILKKQIFQFFQS